MTKQNQSNRKATENQPSAHPVAAIEQPHTNFEERDVHLASFRAHPANYNTHPASQIEHLRMSLHKFGQPRNIVVWRDMFVAGHGLAQAAMAEGWETLRANVIPDDWPEARVMAYLVADNELARLSSPDEAMLAALLDEARNFDDELLDAIGYSDREFGELLAKVSGDAPPADDEEDEPDEEPALLAQAAAFGIGRSDVPDAVWPSDNEWGIPLLDLGMQALGLDQPWAIWGSVARAKRIGGTWLFYTEDRRYEALWMDPSPLLHTECKAAVEPNFSCYENMPPAVALWQIYRKRWISRFWQSRGIRIFVDLNVATNHYALNMLGIPQGWSAFATRGYASRLDATHQEYGQAKQLAGEKTPLFVVYGGGVAVKEECQRNGWLWLQENMDSGKGREV